MGSSEVAKRQPPRDSANRALLAWGSLCDYALATGLGAHFVVCVSFVYSLSSVLAGPVLRRTEPTRVSVWLALKHESRVALRVLDATGSPKLMGEVQTVPIGENFHVALVTATGTEPLDWGGGYHYEVHLDDEPLDTTELLYETGPKWLSFVLPGATLQDTRMLHGSCRHPTQPGPDALTIVDDLIAASFENGERPQLFVCSGDTIYADSPSASMLAMVGEVGDALLGYREQLPGLSWSASEIPLERRGELANENAQILAGMPRQLFGFGEFLAMHLLVLSPTLWPDEVPKDLQRFHGNLSKVRRALANTAYYAIFDDHEVTDDWNLTRAWTERVLGAPLGRRMVCNALAAFALVHTWGNEPAHFAEGRAGRCILQALTGGRPSDSELAPLLGVPTEVGATLIAPDGSLPWHVRLKTPVMDLRALDTRTGRHFPSNDPHGIPDQLSPAALQEQLFDIEGMLVLITPAPLAPQPHTRAARAIRDIRNWWGNSSKVIGRVYAPDRGDEWEPRSEFFQTLVEYLPARCVCLGGDTHIAYAATIERETGRAAVFVSSGMQRESRERDWRQRLGYNAPWPWRSRPPVIETEAFAMRYLRSEETSAGKTYEYFAKNNIGALTFEDEDGQWRVTHTLWWRGEDEALETVAYRVTL